MRSSFFSSGDSASGDEMKIGRLLADREAIDVARIVARGAEKIAQRQPISAVLLRLEADERIAARGAESQAADVGGGGRRTSCTIGGFALDEEERIRRQIEPLGDDFDPPDVALFRLEGERVDVARREKLPGDFARRRELLRFLRRVVRLVLGDAPARR